MAGGVATRPAVAARVDVAARDWAAAVRAAARLLADTGAVSPRYVERCVQIVRTQGPYIVIAPGIAVAHARPEDGAAALALSAVRLRDPVSFAHPANDPVDVVLAFSSPDRDQHVGLLAALARRLAAGMADRLRAATSDEAARAVLEEVVSDGF